VVLPLRYEGRRIDPDVFDGVVVFFAFFALTLAATATALSLIGLDLATAVSGALTALCNVGPGVGAIIGPAGSFASLPDSAKLVLTAAMYLGRLEMLTVFVLLTPRFWAAA
jgi:trk system potassium uptake protein TrkH